MDITLSNYEESSFYNPVLYTHKVYLLQNRDKYTHSSMEN